MHRRSFLQHAGCAVCTVAAEQLLAPASSAIAAEAYAGLDQTARLNLADMALDLAKRAGADYADFRIGRSEREFTRSRERRLEELTSAVSVGFGCACWSMAAGACRKRACRGSRDPTHVALAAENARAAA
jgi:TldD protein